MQPNTAHKRLVGVCAFSSIFMTWIWFWQIGLILSCLRSGCATRWAEGEEYMVTYVKDPSKWEVWQHDYRLGLILIMPPEDVSHQIDPLREKYDPYAFAICPTHISLSDPLRREMTLEYEKEIEQILGKIEPFVLHYDKLFASTEYAGVIYPITPQQPIDRLKEALHVAKVFEGKVYSRRRIPAHMTIAEFISIEDGLKLCADLQETAPSGSFLCDRLEFIVPDQGFHFQKVRTFFLGTSVSKLK